MAHGLSNQTQQTYYDGDNFGGYQFISLDEVMDNFSATYVGEGKLLEKTLRSDISFHAHRALQELSYDTLKSCKTQEIEVSPSLTMPLPHDYVNYVKLAWIDSSGIEHIIYPTSKTSNPNNVVTDATPAVQSWGGWTTDGTTTDLDSSESSDTWDNYDSLGVTDIGSVDADDMDDEYGELVGGRYGIDPQHAQANGSFFIDENKGKMYFSSNMSSKTVTLKYISDSLGTDDEMRAHKFAEEAMYKWMAHAILSTRINIPEYIIARFKKERFAEVRKAKLRLSNIKLEEITQVMRGKSKHIKH